MKKNKKNKKKKIMKKKNNKKNKVKKKEKNKNNDKKKKNIKQSLLLPCKDHYHIIIHVITSISIYAKLTLLLSRLSPSCWHSHRENQDDDPICRSY